MSAANFVEFINSRLEEDPKAIIGGTKWEEGGHPEPIRELEQDSDFGEVVEAVYGIPGEDLVEAVGDSDVFVKGGTIGNPYSRLVNTEIDPEQLNNVAFGELGAKRRYALTFDAQTLSSRIFNEDMELQRTAEELIDKNNNYGDLTEFEQTLVAYATPAEEFRVDEDLRPDYVIDSSVEDFENVYVVEEGELKELDDHQISEYLSDRFAPTANGNEWRNDFGILGVHEKPYRDGNVVAAQGAHSLATEGITDLLTYPEDDTKGNRQVLEYLDDFRQETGAEEFQAIVQTQNIPGPADGDSNKSRDDITYNNLFAVGEV